ncbi:MAG: cytochrome c biogenesis protein CcsA, partial [Bacteroidaceae bacterium]|nr:cytochrome c biogenesis protein CcsA [Bacteroidaceae bacterium]
VLLLFFAIRYSSATTFMQQIKMGAIAGAIFAIFLLHSSGIILRWYVSSQPPWSNTYETMLYIAWCVALGGLLFMKKSSIVLALSSVMAAVTLLISSLNWLDPVITPLMPVLNSPWLILHVTVITASYGFFAICAVIGLYSLIISFKRDSDKVVKELAYINEFLMYIGLILVTVGTFLGAIWANLSWGRYWGWDAKESWALITIFVYAIVTHTRLVPKLKNDIIFSGLSIFATLSVLMTYFGVNYYLSGLHSYGNNNNPPAIEYVIIFYTITALIWIVAMWRQKRIKKNRK